MPAVSHGGARVIRGINKTQRAVGASGRTSYSGKTPGEKGYAMVSVLFLVAVLSLLCAIIIRVQVFQRDSALRLTNDVDAGYAAENGIEAALASLSSGGSADTSFALRFADGSRAEVTIYQWGLYAAATSVGHSSLSTVRRSALIASRLSTADKQAFVLGNVQHGLVLAGKSQIVGDVIVGPRGVSTGSLKNQSAPTDVPVKGSITKVSSRIQVLDTPALEREILRMKSFMAAARRPRISPDNAAGIVVRTGSLDLRTIGDAVETVTSTGNLTLKDTIMRRGPPLAIVVRGSVSFAAGTCVIGPVCILSSDSISIPPEVRSVNTIFASPSGIDLQQGASIAAQLWSPVIRCSQGSRMRYPSLIVSVSLSDTGGVAQLVDVKAGASVDGAIVMQVGPDVSMNRTVTDLETGAMVTGQVYTNGFLTLDGSVRGLVRAYDLYFYDSPTTDIGWIRHGIVDRTKLPHGFLRPLGVASGDRKAVLAWM